VSAATERIDERLDALASYRFRRRFVLRDRERAQIVLRGMTTFREHAEDLVRTRLAPAVPRNDGKQTPYRGHPVFVGQHATATCCRTCLARHHGIAKGHELGEDERDYVLDVLCRWVEREFAPDRPPA
jgi:hypothetical protein